jgi:hypothetical protein
LTNYYLDTTVQVERWFGAASSQARVAELLEEDGDHSTSTHVLREWKRFVDQSAVEMLNTLVSDDPNDDLPRLVQGHGREANRRILVLFSIVKEGKGSAWTRDELRLRAQQMLEFRSDEMFREDMKNIQNSSECGLAENVAAMDQAGHHYIKVTCKKSEHICRQPQAIEDELQRWRAGAEALRESEAHRSMGETGLKMAHSETERKGVNCYGRTGDLSIAVDCPADATILTTDASFEVMSPGVQREVLRLPPTKRPLRGQAL